MWELQSFKIDVTHFENLWANNRYQTKTIGESWDAAVGIYEGSENSLCHFLSMLANGEDSVGRNRKLCIWFL